MDFPAVLQKARQLLEHCQPCTHLEAVTGKDSIYGRVLNTTEMRAPKMLSSDAERKSVFVFGPDAVESILLKQSAYDILCSIGHNKEYLYHKACGERIILCIYQSRDTLQQHNLGLS